MSQENVELVRRGLEAWNAHGSETLSAFVDDDLVVRRLSPMPDPGTWYGPEGLREANADWARAFAEFTMEAVEFIDAGDRVVVRLEQEGRGAVGNVPVTGTSWFVFGLRDRRLVTLDMYGRGEDALSAVGLSD